METTFGRTVETRKVPKPGITSMTDLVNLHNQTFDKFMKNTSNYSLTNNENYFNTSSYHPKKASNASLNLTSEKNHLTTLERNIELNQQLKFKFTQRVNNQNEKPFSSTLLPRKKYNLSGYSSDSDCCNKQFDQLSSGTKQNNRSNRNQTPSITANFHELKTHQLSDHPYNINNSLEFERLQHINSRMNRFKSIERQHISKRHYPETTIKYSTHRPLHQFNPNTDNVSNEKFTLSSNQATSTTATSNNNDADLIKNINDYFLRWKTFNYDPMETSDQDLTQPTDFNALVRETSSRIDNHTTILQEINNISSTLPRSSKFSETLNENCFSTAVIKSPVKYSLAKQRSLNQETSYTDSQPPVLTKPNYLKLTGKASPRVEAIVPLENALLNMNEILKNLALTAEKKKTEYEIMQSVINEFEALKTSDIPSPSVSTSISIPPTRSSLPTNISPSSSSSSSSYTNSSKTSDSSVVSSHASADSSKTNRSTDSGRGSQASCDLIPGSAKSGQGDQRKSRPHEKSNNKSFSFGKKVKRFFSLNSSKDLEDEEEKVILKKNNKKKEFKTLC